jgi:hypothetical protein
VRVDSGRERAEIFANAQGLVVGADVSGTQRAKTLNIFKEPDLAAQAAMAFRDLVGAGRVLTKVGIEKKIIGFNTNIADKTGIVTRSMPVTETFTWDLNGLQRRIGEINVNAATGAPALPAFAVGDVDWTVVGALENSALDKAPVQNSTVTHVGVAGSTEQPGAPVLVWTVDVTDPDGEVTKVVADLKGVITRVILPPSRRPKIDWCEPAALAGAIARIGTIFGPEAKIASIVANGGDARITVDDPAHGGQPSTFEFSEDAVTRASISFSLEAMGPRFGVADLASLTQEKLAALEADALKKLGNGRQVYLESVTIGAHPFVRQAGAHAIEVRVRNIPEDSARANYAWIVYDFSGRALDSSKF